MPTTSAAKTAQVEQEVDRLVHRVRATLADPHLDAAELRRALHELADELAQLQQMESELVKLTAALAASFALLQQERTRHAQLFEFAVHTLRSVHELVADKDDQTDTILRTIVGWTAQMDGTHVSVLLHDAAGELTAEVHADAPAAELCALLRAVGDPLEDLATRFGDEPVDLASQARWAEVAEAAARHGASFVLLRPVDLDGERSGVLVTFGADPDAVRHVGSLLGAHVSVAIDSHEVLGTAREEAVHLQRALESRGVIDQAKGILMARWRCSAEEAFDRLRTASQEDNRKLHAVAQELVDQTSRPGPRSGP